MITFCIPGPPQGKGRARAMRTRGGKTIMVTPEKTVSYEGLIAYTAKAAMSRAGAKLMEGAVLVWLHIDCQIPVSWSAKKRAAALAAGIIPTTKPDADNVLKAVLDGCNGIVFRDDAQCADVYMRKRYAETPGVRVRVSEIGVM